MACGRLGIKIRKIFEVQQRSVLSIQKENDKMKNVQKEICRDKLFAEKILYGFPCHDSQFLIFSSKKLEIPLTSSIYVFP